MQEFDLDIFKGNHFVVHCKTEEEAIDFCREMNKHGLKWASGHEFIDYTNWVQEKELTCYWSRGEFGSINYAVEHGCKIIEWSDYMKEE